MANVVMRLGTEDVDKALRPLQSLRVKTTAADWLLAMAYQVNGGSSIGQSNKTQEEEISKEHIGFTTNAKAKDHFQKLQGVCVYAVRFGSPTIFIWLSTFQHQRAHHVSDFFETSVMRNRTTDARGLGTRVLSSNRIDSPRHVAEVSDWIYVHSCAGDKVRRGFQGRHARTVEPITMCSGKLSSTLHGAAAQFEAEHLDLEIQIT